jgi:hypothetical protein
MEDKFIEIYTNNIKREGADKLLDWLKTTDFFTAPSSTRFHGAFEGGLVKHSVNVYNRLFHQIFSQEVNLNNNVIEELEEKIAIVSLLHDLCKVNFYKQEMRNVKEDGNWVQKPFYTIEDKLPYGHGEKSVYIISGFMKLTREESMAIRWHMGGFDDSVKGGSYSLSGAFEQYPLALELHIADMRATYLDEKEEKGDK